MSRQLDLFGKEVLPQGVYKVPRTLYERFVNGYVQGKSGRREALVAEATKVWTEKKKEKAKIEIPSVDVIDRSKDKRTSGFFETRSSIPTLINDAESMPIIGPLHSGIKATIEKQVCL